MRFFGFILAACSFLGATGEAWGEAEPQTLVPRGEKRSAAGLPEDRAPVEFSRSRNLPDGRRRLWQPVQEYFTIVTPSGSGRQSREHTVNPFLSYTHLGTDFGFLGPGERDIGWVPGMVWAQLPAHPDGWAGLWHSLARLARLPGEVMDFERPFAPWIGDRWQPQVVGVRAEVAGRGTLKLELKGARQDGLWSVSRRIESSTPVVWSETVDPSRFRAAKLLNWTAEPGADLKVDAVGFEMVAPEVPFAEWVFAVSYAKAARCYSPGTGFMRDRAHTEDGAFDSVPATGLFLLATAAAADRGLVAPEEARKILHRSWSSVSGLAGPRGLLPHFSRQTADGFGIHPGTEFSTVDTAIFLHAALLAAAVMGDEAMGMSVVEAMRDVEFGPLRTADGYVSHGLREDKVTRIPYIWSDWGGETALVLLLQQVASQGALTPRMADTGRVHQGTGFIAELQSLLFPDFSQPQPDAVSAVDWLESRQRLLADQKAYFQRAQPPEGFARRHGLYGLSAGEGAYGIGYHVGGADLPGQALIHPHYVMMAAALDPDPAVPLATLERMEALHLLPPWGLVENVFADGTESLPLQAGLNASFEALGAYHLLARAEGKPNAIHRAASAHPAIREAMSVFYPAMVR